MNYGLNNNTGLPNSQANNGMQTWKKGLTSAQKGAESANEIINFQDALKAKDSKTRIKAWAGIAKLIAAGA